MNPQEFEQQFCGMHPELTSFRHPVLVGFSGGADSVALARLLWRAKQKATSRLNAPLIVAHFNHRLRGEESEGDAQFARRWAESHDCHFVLGESAAPGQEPAQEPEGEPERCGPSAKSNENVWRRARLQFLQSAAEQYQVRYVALGHHRDDQTETILFRLCRGTSLAGLTGIPGHRPLSPHITLVRPLITYSRQSLREYLDAVEQDFRHDASNDASHYSRNWIRRQLIPAIESRWGVEAGIRINELGQQAAEQMAFLDELIAPLLPGIVTATANRIEIRLAALSQQSRVLARHLLYRMWQHQQWPLGSMTAEHWRALLDKLSIDNGLKIGQTWQAPGSIWVRRTSRELAHIERASAD